MMTRRLIRRLSTVAPKHVGLVGLGAMGLPMCQNLLDAGFAVAAYDVNPESVSAAVAVGATRCASPAEAAKDADAIITMVPNDAVLRQVVCDPETGILAALPRSKPSPGSVHISCSTVHPDTSRELAKLHEAAGSAYVGAPIFARADGVAQRLASFVVGGRDDAVAAAMPLLEANSNGIFRFGASCSTFSMTRTKSVSAWSMTTTSSAQLASTSTSLTFSSSSCSSSRAAAVSRLH